jgi:hypothetical protein
MPELVSDKMQLLEDISNFLLFLFYFFLDFFLLFIAFDAEVFLLRFLNSCYNAIIFFLKK